MSKQLVKKSQQSFFKKNGDQNIDFFEDVTFEELIKMEMASEFKQYVFDFKNGLSEVVA